MTQDRDGEAWTADLDWLDGLFVGSLGDDDRKAFDRAVGAGFARETYEGVGGFLGLAKVRLNREALRLAREGRL